MLCLSAPSRAAGDDISVRARAAFERGERAYEAGHYTEAIQAFHEADELAPSPPLSFDLGRCYERSGADREALAAYREYLVRAPQAHNRADVERRIQALEQRLPADEGMRGSGEASPTASAVPAPAVPPPAVPPPAEPSAGAPEVAPPQSNEGTSSAPSDAPTARADAPQTPASVPPASPSDAARAAPSWWTWGLWGVSAASFAGAGGFELARRHWDQRAHQTSIQVEYARDFASMQRRQTAARVLLGVGAAAALGGGLSLYFDLSRSGGAPSQLALSCNGSECWLTTGGQF